ncbi:MAG TPA: glycosyltransferase family 39 protein, partial [Promineifilum sp.]|nr:glycosyltransferase family 39 protein [Promineifilum sp.]
MMSSRLYRYRWLLMVVLLLAGFALRLYRLDYQSVWWGEGISLHLATSGMGEIILDRLNNIHPPLYFFILKGWLALVGVTPFTGRYLSTLAGFAQIAVVFAVARHWSGRVYRDRSPIPWIAAFLLLISPLSVIYAQEIRVYAMLPLCYLAMLWQAERLLDGERLTARSLLILGVLQWTGLHLHYIAIFAVAYIALWGVVVLSRRQDWSGLRRWIVLHALVALASLPWLAAVLSNWAAVRAEAGAGTFTTDPVPPLYLLAQVWTFHLTGLAGALSSDLVRAGAAMTAICLTGLAIICLSVNDGEPAM